MKLITFLLFILIKTPEKFLQIIQEYCKIDTSLLPDGFLAHLSELTDHVVKNLTKTTLYKALKDQEVLQYPKYILDTSKLSTKYRSVTTLNGYPFDIAKSAVQKYIRRGMVSEAQAIACEMDIYRYVPDAKGSMTNFVNRIRIILLEDIGIAAPHEILIIADMIEKWLSSEDLSLDLVKLVKIMCQVPHSRYYSHVKFYYEYKLKPKAKKPKQLVPLGDNEFMRKSVDPLVWCLENKSDQAIFWIMEILNSEQKLIGKISNKTDVGYLIFDILDRIIVEKSSLLVQTIALCKKWYGIMKMKERFLLCVHPVYVYVLDDTYEKHTLPDISGENLIPYKIPLLNIKPEISDYVVDMHTHRGRSLGRDKVEFGTEGAFVAYDTHTNDEYADFYLASKIAAGMVKLESSEFTLKARAQVICSASRPDTYFALNKLGQNVCVKGPFLAREHVIKILDIVSILRLFDQVNVFDCSMKFLVPDIFTGDQATTFGTRTKIDPDTPYYFLVMEDLLEVKKYPTTIKNTKVWKDAIIVDFDKVFTDKNLGYGSPSSMSESSRYSFLIQLSIRYIFKMGDFASRNFIRVGELVYNIDIDNVDVNNSIRFAKEEKNLMIETIRLYREPYLALLESWKMNAVAWSLIKYTSLPEKIVDIAIENINLLLTSPEIMFT